MMDAAGHESHAQLFGIFEVSVLHNIVHLLFGLAGLALARAHDTAPLVPGRRGRRLPRALAFTGSPNRSVGG